MAPRPHLRYRRVPLASPRTRAGIGRNDWLILVVLLAGCGRTSLEVPAGSRLIPAIGLDPSPPSVRQYQAPRRVGAITVDGSLDDSAWTAVPWTEPFVDIEGADRLPPTWVTRAKITWDESRLYIAAQLDEPHLWATLTSRDAVIFRDNDFEVFIDPDDDTHRYFELEINALGTVWDLFLPRPYRDGGSAVNEWDITGLQSAVDLDGTLNDPSDRDRGWSVELGIPWTVFFDSAGTGRAPPSPGSVWRVNFSRVQWQLDHDGRDYRKRIDSVGRPLDEANWVWSPQYAINMHLPELWGRVQFVDTVGGIFPPDGEAEVRWLLRRLYYQERIYRERHGVYAPSVVRLGLTVVPPGLELSGTPLSYRASLPTADGIGRWYLESDGRIWRH